MMLFAGLAKRNPGAVDWSPHVPKMFSRIMHSLHLPVSYKDMQISKAHCFGKFQWLNIIHQILNDLFGLVKRSYTLI